MVKEIPLTRGQVALVDDIDYPLVSQYKWHASKERYVWYAVAREHGTCEQVRMHRLLLGLEKGEICDHRNSVGTDNRRCNIRKVTQSQNCMNQRKTHGLNKKYKGVFWRSDAKKWSAKIAFNHKQYYLGLFVNEEDAARAYDKAAKELFGEFARLNFPETL